MSESVSLPALGESVTEGTVTRWLKQVGDRVEVDEPLLEVSTDKVDTEIPSPVAGVVEQILVQEDETVEVGAQLVVIGDGSSGTQGGDAPATESAPAPAEQASAEPEQGSTQAAEIPAAGTPSAAPTQDPQEQSPHPDLQQQPFGGERSSDPDSAQDAEARETPGQIAGEAGAGTAAAADAEYAKTTAEEPVSAPQEAPAEAPAPQESPTPQDSPTSQYAPTPQDAPTPQAAPAQQDAPAPQEAPASQAQAPQERLAESDHQPVPSDAPHAGYVTPIVRKLAHEKGIDLAGLTGTGVGGRIRKQDVLDAAEKAAAPAAPESEPEAQPAAPAPAASPEVSPLRGTTVPMSRLRKVVAERAVVSMQTTAQLTTVVEVDVTRVAKLRDRVKGEFVEKTGTKLSFLPFFTLAAAEALKSYPIINATVDGDSIVYPDHENVSIAVDTERGLLTPVVRNASELSIADLAREIADLASRTRENKLKPDELSGGTFTVTNTGSRGALFDTPLVFLPQVAILGTGIVAKKPLVVTQDGVDAIAIRSTVYLALSYDHRIVDGADAARFLTAVKTRLETADFEGQLGL